MGDLLDMNEYRTRQRAKRRFQKDLEETSKHPALDHHPTWVPGGPEGGRPTDELRGAIVPREQSLWAYGPEGLSGGLDTVEEAGPPLADVVPLGPARAASVKGRTEAYINDIVEKASAGSKWAAFRMALLQLTDQEPGAARESMQLAFPDMIPEQFEIWLDRAIEEFDEYSNILEQDDHP